MKLLPWDKQKIKTVLTKEEVLKKLSLTVDSEKYIPRSFIKDKGNKFFAGKIRNNKFKIFRILQYRNSFRPIIIGEIEEDQHGTIIFIKMRLHLLVILLQILWCSVLLFGVMIFLNKTITNHHLDHRLTGALFLLMLNYLMTIIVFNIQRNKSLDELKKIFETTV